MFTIGPFKIFIFFLVFYKFVVFIIIHGSSDVEEDDVKNYILRRNQILDSEKSMSFGSSIVLNEKEKVANEILMKCKNKELTAAFLGLENFLPKEEFQSAIDSIEKSKIFQFIRKMPKGGILHFHTMAAVTRGFILNNATRRENLYACRDDEIGTLKLHFFDRPKNDQKCHWKLLSELRKENKNIDLDIEEALSMLNTTNWHTAKNSDLTWKKFLDIFDFLKGIVNYRPVHEDFLYEALEDIYEDNVQFVEFRTRFSSLYELDGHQHDYLQVIEIYSKVVDRFVRAHPDFVDVKWIYSRERQVDRQDFKTYVDEFRELRKVHPEKVVGFDLVGQEDKGMPLVYFINELKRLGKETDFYFHAGETNWYGFESDENLVDAILLGAKRIGHGFALTKHPELLALVKDKDIAIEVNPISNQVLKLVKDLRNHPASFLFSQNFPIVVSNDDPGFWKARALSYDYYEAFMGIMSRYADLRALKQLAVNSVKYSSFSDAEKCLAMRMWEKKWSFFIDGVLEEGDVCM